MALPQLKEGTVGDYVGHHALLLHYLGKLQGPIGLLLTLLAGADQCAIGDYIRHGRKGVLRKGGPGHMAIYSSIHLYIY